MTTGAQRCRDRRWPGFAIPAAAAVAGAVPLVWGAAAYQLYDLLHVLAAVAWVGGAATLAIFGVVYELRPNRDGEAVLREQANWLSRWVLVPAAAVSLVTGILLVRGGGWSWGTGWIEVGLGGWAVAAVVPFAVLAPQKRRLARVARERGTADSATQQERSRLLLYTRLQTVLLILMLVEMTLKPSF